MKQCSKCKDFKDLSQFCLDRKSSDQHQSVCKTCKAIAITAYYKTHPQKKYRAKYTASAEDRARGLRKYYRHRLHYNVSRMVREGLGDFIKSRPTFELLGYTVQDLKRHLENQFSEGMSWENYGKYGWHIDHKTPRAELMYDSPEHPNFKRCWSLNNLQPLWCEDNWKKGKQIGPMV